MSTGLNPSGLGRAETFGSTKHEEITTEGADIAELDHPLAVTGGKNRHVDFVDMSRGWSARSDVTGASVTAFAQASIMTPPVESDHYGTWYAFYEYQDGSGDYHIAVATADNPEGPYDNAVVPLLSPDGAAGEPDSQQIADPTVLYLPGRTNPWRMFFDMEDDLGSLNWTVGGAYASGDPTDPSNWTKINTSGTTDILIGTGEYGAWDSGFTHAPEAFVYNDVVYVEYDAKGQGTKYSGGLTVATDADGVGTELTKIGRLTDRETSGQGDSIRIKEPCVIGNSIYCLLSRDTDDEAAVGTIRPDVPCVVPGANFNPDTSNETDKDVSSWLFHEGTIYAVTTSGFMYTKEVW